jgi:hypothetical protein
LLVSRAGDGVIEADALMGEAVTDLLIVEGRAVLVPIADCFKADLSGIVAKFGLVGVKDENEVVPEVPGTFRAE